MSEGVIAEVERKMLNDGGMVGEVVDTWEEKTFSTGDYRVTPDPTTVMVQFYLKRSWCSV